MHKIDHLGIELKGCIIVPNVFKQCPVFLAFKFNERFLINFKLKSPLTYLGIHDRPKIEQRIKGKAFHIELVALSGVLYITMKYHYLSIVASTSSIFTPRYSAQQHSITIGTQATHVK